MLGEEIVPTIEYQMNLEEIFYAYDGAPAYYDQSVRHFLDKTFPDWWIEEHGPIDWPARSLVSTLTDYFIGCDKRLYMQQSPKIFKHSEML